VCPEPCALWRLLFFPRITPEVGEAVCAATPTQAWQQLYKLPEPAVQESQAAAGGSSGGGGGLQAGGSAAAAAARASARAVSVNGPKLFGLQHPLVSGLVQALPNAADCDRFMAWSSGELERPQPQKLVRQAWG